MPILPSTIIRHALIDYRSLLIRLNNDYPETFQHTHPKLIADIDATLYAIEGNVTMVSIMPHACAK